MANTTGTLKKTSEEIKGQICELEKAQRALEDSITYREACEKTFCSLGWPKTR